MRPSGGPLTPARPAAAAMVGTPVGPGPSSVPTTTACSVPHIRVEVIGCGMDAGWGDAADGVSLWQRHGLGDEPVIGFVGRQSKLKGAPTLIAAMRLVWRQQPEAGRGHDQSGFEPVGP